MKRGQVTEKRQRRIKASIHLFNNGWSYGHLNAAFGTQANQKTYAPGANRLRWFAMLELHEMGWSIKQLVETFGHHKGHISRRLAAARRLRAEFHFLMANDPRSSIRQLAAAPPWGPPASTAPELTAAEAVTGDD